MKLLLASSNKGKLAELRDFFSDIDYIDISIDPSLAPAIEKGESFIENARIKAVSAALQKQSWTLADDSGLCVDALDGAPGVRSARYASTDAARIERLLQELKAAGAQDPTSRSARFTTALVIAEPSGKVVLELEGHCPGQILMECRGNRGFGYDPVFYVPEAQLTFAEMSKKLKAKFGHRGRAFAALKPQLQYLLGQEIA